VDAEAQRDILQLGKVGSLDGHGASGEGLNTVSGAAGNRCPHPVRHPIIFAGVIFTVKFFMFLGK
jgi:hypothetical protein